MEKAKVLIVEDEAIIAMEIKVSLERLGYTVTSIVDSGQKALDRVQSDKPDIVLMDIRIKGNVDGIEAAEMIRLGAEIPIIFTTAYLDQERIEQAKVTMPFGYILKPIQDRDLKVTLEMALYVSKVDAKRKEAEEELRLEKEKYKMLYDRAPLSYQSLDENGCFIEVNNEWLNTLGYSKEEVIGRSFGDFIHPDWAEHFKENFPRFKNLGEIIGVEFNMVKKDGSLVLVSFNGKISYNSEGKFQQTHCIFKDITAQKSIADRLRESETKYRLLFDDAIDGYGLANIETGIILDCNKALLNLVGRTRDELVGQPQTILHPKRDLDDQFTNIFKKHISELSGEILEAEVITKSGDIIKVGILARVIEINDKKLLHAIFRKR